MRIPELAQQTPVGNLVFSTSSASLAEAEVAAGPLTASSATVAQGLDCGDKAGHGISAATSSMHSEADCSVALPFSGNDKPNATAVGDRDNDNVRRGDAAVAGSQHSREPLLVHATCDSSNASIPTIAIAIATSETKHMSDRNYCDRFGSYYEYMQAIVDDDKALEPACTDRSLPQRQKMRPPHGPLPMLPPPLRSTYKSEPLMQGRVDLGDPRNSYSQTLENALFYSQAIRKIRETDCVDASDPYAVAVPRARPGKEDIRQRRARNVIASREVFSITTPSAFIPLPSGKSGGGMWALEDMPKVPSIERSLAMRSEPAIKLAAAGGDSVGKQKAGTGTGTGTAVPISRMLPPNSNVPPTASSSSGFFGRSYAHGHGSAGRRGGGESQDTAWEAARRAGIDQPLPTCADFAEGLKQRGVTTSRTAASSIITTRSVQLRQRQRPYSTAESAVVVFGSDEEDDGGSYVAVQEGKRTSIMSQASRTQFRLSMASHFSLASGASQNNSQAQAVQQATPKQQQQQGRATQVSSHSRHVATRLLMRAGFSSIAIRVARLGKAPVMEAIASGAEMSHGADSDPEESDVGVDVDPNGLQTLQAERRKQVKRVDEYGFLQFEGDDERASEYAQQYETWRERRARGRSRAGGLLNVGDEAKLVAGSEAKWETLLQSFDSATLRGSRKVKQLVQAGVPGRMRAQVYYVMSGASKAARSGEYARLLALERMAIFDVIERDVARCYPDHAMFADAEGAGQRQLRRILRAYAQYNPGVGYCQGMGRLVGLFLIVGLGEEQAFWVLATTIANYIPQYYVADLAGLRVHTAVFEALLAERSPRLHAHLADQGCDALMYATPWFMTVFTLSLPWPAALRVWDWFMFRGTKVLFRVALAITDLASAYLLEACPSITELLGFLLHIPHGLVDADALIAAASRVKISERHVDRLTARLTARLN
ncbi:hypothetical protein GGI20_000610 [Coemansia sp. BCRC 34301]|nr:hypothetical protein GGI20_000610 [Coemansia sp. BCRC 34301]